MEIDMLRLFCSQDKKKIISPHQLCFLSLSRDKTNIDLSYPFTHMAGICLRNILSTVADSPSLV